METITQPRERRFSLVGILPWANRQKIKEWDGGMQFFQIEDAHDIGGANNLKKLKACLAVNLSSAACDQARKFGRWIRGSAMESKRAATLGATLTSVGISHHH